MLCSEDKRKKKKKTFQTCILYLFSNIFLNVHWIFLAGLLLGTGCMPQQLCDFLFSLSNGLLNGTWFRWFIRLAFHFFQAFVFILWRDLKSRSTVLFHRVLFVQKKKKNARVICWDNQKSSNTEDQHGWSDNLNSLEGGYFCFLS